ncbi:MAG TPA: TolC family protein [Candidatus Didemnitutus sp.]|nr:TolC family protein [Candidatus Didemnitutus sp.]
MRSVLLFSVLAGLLAVPAAAQLNDGKPDPDFPVPDRLDLPYSLAFALDNNFSIRQAKERIRQQEGVLLVVKSATIPNVAATGDYQRNATEISSNGYDHNWAIEIAAHQTLFAGGGVVSGVKAQKLALEAATLELESVINDALFDVRTKFYTVIVNRERIKVQEQNVELLQRQLQDVKNRFDAGTVSNFEVLRAEVALANAQPALITARNDFRLSIEELRQSLGFVTSTQDNVTKVPEFIGTLDFKPTSYDLASALATARSKRPDLQRLQELQSSAEEGVFVSRAAYYPNLSAFAAYDVRDGSLFLGPGSPSNLKGWTIGLQSQWNIFDGRATEGRVAQSKSLLEQSKLATAEATLAIDVDVRRSISSFQQANELAEASQKVVTQAEESVRLANARFGAGTATQLDVLQAETDLTTARLNQLQAYYSYNIAVATVRKAMGETDEMRPTGELPWPPK